MTDPETLWAMPRVVPAIGGGELHVWRIDLDDDAWPGLDPMGDLADDEARRASRLHFERDRRRFVSGRAALRRILGSYCEVPPGELRFRYGEHGKPGLRTPPGNPDIRFNFAHSRGLALCAVARGNEVGVDAERLRPREDLDRIASRFFSSRERETFRSLDPASRSEAFFRCWTRKEAYLKATGRGIFGGSTGFDVSLGPTAPARLLRVHDAPEEAARWTLHDLSPQDGYVGAVIVEGAARRLRRFVFDTAA